MALYDTIGQTYAGRRQSDPRIAAMISDALGDAGSVANIGAGAGSYEPDDRDVIAIEPSAVMIAQRPEGAAPCLQAWAENLPLESRSVDAAMAILSVHHWRDMERGLAEMKRVARRRVVLLTWVPEGERFWLTEDYFPQVAAHDRNIFPTTGNLKALLTCAVGPADIRPVPIPNDCVDGFLCAYWQRPEAYLDPAVRSGISSFSRFDAEEGLAYLRADLESGRWLERNRGLLAQEAVDFGYRVVRCDIP